MNINDLKAAFAAKAEGPQARAERRCVSPPIGCGQPIEPGFRDALSAREYEISGWCQACQDRVFVEPEDDGPEHTLDDLPAYFLRDQTLALVDFTPWTGTASSYDSSRHPVLGRPVSEANLITSLTQAQPLSGERQHRPLLDVGLPLEVLSGAPGPNGGTAQVRVELATSESTVEDVQYLLEHGKLDHLLQVYRARHEFVMLWHAPVIVRETSPGKHHLYVDAVIPWSAYSVLLTALGAVGVLEKGYVSASLARGYTALRVPWVCK